MIQLAMPSHRPVAVYAQSVAAALLTRLGYQLAVPQDATLPFDLIASRDPHLRLWETIQVKQASRGGVVGLRRGDKGRGCNRYRAGDFDLLAVVDLDAGVYLIPYRAIQHLRSQVCVRDTAFGCYRVAGPMPIPHAAPLVHRVAPIPEPEQLPLFAVRVA